MRNIELKLNLVGQGIVNFDSPSQKFFLYKHEKTKHLYQRHDNVKYSKKFFYEKDGNVDYKIKISDVCLKHEIFKEDCFTHTPDIINYDYIFYNYIASPLSILRGYLFASETTYKKKSCFTLCDAIQTNNALSYLDINTRGGQKKTTDDTDDENKDTSLYNTETVGDITYEAKGFINLNELQFISCDDLFDRLSFNPDKFPLYKECLLKHIPDFDGELKYYNLKNSKVELAEYGFKLDEKTVNYLVKYLLQNILKMQISRKNAFVKVESIEYRIDGGEFKTINNIDDINNINIELDEYYVEFDFNKAIETRDIIKEKTKQYQQKINAAKKAKKESKKKSKTVVEEND